MENSTSACIPTPQYLPNADYQVINQVIENTKN